MPATTDPATYAKLPAGTRMLFGAVADDTASLTLLEDANAVGATGLTAGFIETTRLIDTQRKYMSDLAEGPDKEFVFLDNPANADLQAFLAKAEAKEAVKIRIEFPNNRWADMVVALGGWTLQELDKSAPMMVVVAGKQNSIDRGVTA